VNYFRTNLKFLRKSFQVRQGDIGACVGKQAQAISNWEAGLSEPSMNDLVSLSKFFNIRLDILVMVNIPKAKLITEDHINEFLKKGKLKVYTVDHDSSDHSGKEAQEPDSPLWQVLDELKMLNSTVGKLSVEVKKKIR
jgi:transcriptional regulator with XRE-family HTH domain